jgi:hypothetical protein
MSIHDERLPLQDKLPPMDPKRRGAVGKAFLVYLGTGSLGAAIIAFIIFKVMGC